MVICFRSHFRTKGPRLMPSFSASDGSIFYFRCKVTAKNQFKSKKVRKN